jgi:excisionase family DNA binding protein
MQHFGRLGHAPSRSEQGQLVKFAGDRGCADEIAWRRSSRDFLMKDVPERRENNKGVNILLSINEACQELGIGRTLLYKLINLGELEVTRIGNRTLISRAAIDRLVAANTQERRAA